MKSDTKPDPSCPAARGRAEGRRKLPKRRERRSTGTRAGSRILRQEDGGQKEADRKEFRMASKKASLGETYINLKKKNKG